MNKYDENQMRNRTRRDADHFGTRAKNFGERENCRTRRYAPSQRLTISLFLNRMFNVYETYVQSPLYRRSLGTDDPPLRTSTASGPVLQFACSVMMWCNYQTTYKF